VVGVIIKYDFTRCIPVQLLLLVVIIVVTMVVVVVVVANLALCSVVWLQSAKTV
jgi:hypothetical protein